LTNKTSKEQEDPAQIEESTIFHTTPNPVYEFILTEEKSDSITKTPFKKTETDRSKDIDSIRDNTVQENGN
jgi:hypothetical protein